MRFIRLPGLAVCFVFATAACRDAFTANVSIVARAGPSELTVDRLGEIFAQGKALATERDVVERVVQLWIDYALFAHRLAGGDSLLDSATVVSTLWPEVQQRLTDHFHERLIERDVKVDSARIDSIYAQGQLRLIHHLLWRADASMSPPQRSAKRRRAEQARARLETGGSWTQANAQNEDPQSRSNGGTLGVVARGDVQLPQVEQAAFALAPGELSGIVESPLGYHLAYRPRLAEVRDAFARGVEDRLVNDLDSNYLAGLAERRRISVDADAPARVRAALADPGRAARSRTVLGRFDGGSFRVRDLVRWVHAMGPQLQQQVTRADDAQLNQFLRQLMRNQAMMLEADSAGARLTPLDVQEFTAIMRGNLKRMTDAMKLDGVASPGDAELRVSAYLEAMVNGQAAFVSVPPFLASQLREQGEWGVVPAGVDRALERARILRAAIDSARAGPPPATTIPLPTAGDTGGSNATKNP